MLFLDLQTQTEEVQAISNSSVRILLRCKCNRDRSSHLLSSCVLVGKPVRLTDNLKTIVEGADFVFENVQTFKRSGDAMDGNLVPGSDGKSLLELSSMLPDVHVFQQILCIECRCCGQNNVPLLAMSG